jgi:ATP-dependent Clp protease adapter protein ClpS
MPEVSEVIDPSVEPADVSKDGGGWVCVIFNNDYNTMEEVVAVLMRATGCPYEEAYCEMWEAHHYGQAVCHYGNETECREVAAVVSAIGVRTDVRREWS